MDISAVKIGFMMSEPRPLSINKMYSGVGNRFLTAEGKKFKAALTAVVAREIMTYPKGWSTVVDAVYKYGAWVALDIWLYLPAVRNRSWKVGGCMTRPGKRKDGTRPKPTPRSPYQKVDATNYVKLIEDAVANGTGIDDSAHLRVTVRKLEDTEDPRVEIYYSVYV